MRIVVAKRLGRRGEGLGNEMLPWAKGWIASQVLDAHLVGPSWGVNRRKYYRNFGTSRFDFLLEDMLLRLPHHSITEDDYRATGETDFGLAVEKWARGKHLTKSGSYIVSVAGMWGGYPAIRNARSFLLAKLLSSRDALRNVFQVSAKLAPGKLFAAVHMRTGGDFSPISEGESARGKFNRRVPGVWNMWVCEALLKHFGDRIEFRFFTDQGGPDFEEAVRRFNPGQSVQEGLTECSDLLLMTMADIRICSISSYSLVASFLSGGPYLWYEPQLTLTGELYSLWGAEPRQMENGSLSQRSRAFVSSLTVDAPAEKGLPVDFMGTAMDIGDELPRNLVYALENRLRSVDPRTNLLEYGCLPSFERSHAR